MAIEITVPRLGWSMEEGTFAGWLKPDGAAVRKGELLFTLEGDKSAQDVESFHEGVLRRLPDGPKAGDVVRVGQLLGHLLAEGEAPPSSASRTTAPESEPAAIAVERERAEASPVVVVSARSGPASSPRARRRAEELGVDLARLTGSGRTGRIRDRDVLAAVASRAGSADRSDASFRPHSTLRKAIAQRLVASHLTTAPVTLTAIADATNLVNLRGQFRRAAATGTPAPTYNDLLVKLTARALRDHPAFNARWTDEGLHLSAEIHIGLAVDVETGLVSPVLRQVDRKGLRALAAESADLIARARGGRLAPGDLQGGTFTISSLGSFGIEAFTPIVNPPQVAILGVGQIRRQPVYRDADSDRLAPRDLMTLSLTFDHRAVDGGPAARFLQAIVQGIENPAERLID